jgi:hypothetical protein
MGPGTKAQFTQKPKPVRVVRQKNVVMCPAVPSMTVLKKDTYTKNKLNPGNACYYSVQNILTRRLKVGIVEPEEMFLARQRLSKQVPA